MSTARSTLVAHYTAINHNTLVTVPEQVLVLFWGGTTSLRSGLGTFFVPQSNHAEHFHQSYCVCKVDKKTNRLTGQQLVDITVRSN